MQGLWLRSMRPILRALGVIVIVIVAMAGFFGPSPASAKSVVWKNYDVTLTLNGDGTYHVVERQVVAFEGGPFTYAFDDILLVRVDDITNVAVSEERDGVPVRYEESTSHNSETYQVERSSSKLSLTWYMPETTDQVRTFLVEYEVVGNLRVYESETGTRQQIWWEAVGDDETDIAPVEAASLTIELPQAVDLATVVLDGPGSDEPAEHSSDGRVFTWTMANLESGDSLVGRLEFPALVSAVAPSWQQADDETRLREEDRESRDALLKLMLAGAGLLAATAGGVGLYGLWYTRGRDPGVGAVATYLSEPPDDLPPGAAGALVDEVVNERDIVATLVDLGRRGVLKISQEADDSALARRDFTIELQQSDASLRPFETAFVSAIMGSAEAGAKVQLGQAKSRFNSKLETIKSQMYDEVVKRGYFPVSPQSTRSRYQGFATILLVGGAILLGLFGSRLFGISGWIIVPVAALAILIGALFLTAKYMPRKTVAGAEAAAKWRAFKRYLADLDENRATEGAGELFEKFLPYAVAFGLERSWVNRFAAAGAPAPEWYGGFGGGGDWLDPEMRRYPRRRGSAWGGWVGIPTATSGRRGDDGGSLDMPNIPGPQEMSDKGAKSLQSLSGGLFDLFDLAGSAFKAFGSSGGRHGGFSGGGGGFGGGGGSGGGGGGRGFG